jgi:prepilin-type processing-associated H-X9-DG protein
MLTTAWPIITCPAQIRFPIPADATIDKRVTYRDKGRINSNDNNSRPFGYPDFTIPPVAGAPYKPLKLLGILNYTNNLGSVFALRDVDMQLDSGSVIIWQTAISPQAIHGKDLRNAVFFDWHAESVRGTNWLH